jgi:hypothetical protein
LFLLMITMSGIIYKISSPKGNKVYYGSTTQTLAQRFSNHLSDYNTCSSSLLFNEYGVDDCIIEKIEEVTIGSLLERELYWIDIDENCINKNRPWVSEDDKKEREKEWRKRNNEQLLQKAKEYYEQNKEKRKEYAREQAEQNREKKKEYDKEWYEKNREKKKESSRLYRLKKKELSGGTVSL